MLNIIKCIDKRCLAMRGRYKENPNLRISGLPTEQRMELGVNDGLISTALTTIIKDGMVLEVYKVVKSDKIIMGSIDYDVTDKFYTTIIEGISRTLLAAKVIGVVELHPNTRLYKIRRYTPKEELKLMGFNEEDYEKLVKMGISESAIYHACGNGIVTNCCKLLAQHLYKAQDNPEYQCEDEIEVNYPPPKGSGLLRD